MRSLAFWGSLLALISVVAAFQRLQTPYQSRHLTFSLLQPRFQPSGSHFQRKEVLSMSSTDSMDKKSVVASDNYRRMSPFVRFTLLGGLFFTACKLFVEKIAKSSAKYSATLRLVNLASIAFYLTQIFRLLRTESNSAQLHGDKPADAETMEKFFVILKPMAFMILLSRLLGRIKPAHAASSSGWGLFGRMPHDDWLFTTERLIDKNLLKKTLVEAVCLSPNTALALHF